MHPRRDSTTKSSALQAPNDPGRIVFEAYFEVFDDVSSNGGVGDGWVDLPEEEQARWRKLAAEIARRGGEE